MQLSGPLTESLDGQMLRYSQLILIYDDKSKKRVASLVKTLAVTFRGAVFVTLARIEDFRKSLIGKETSFILSPPSILFVPFRNGTLLEVNNYFIYLIVQILN